MTDGTRMLVSRIAGVALLALGLGAALLPSGPQMSERVAIGGLLAIAGVIELVGVLARRRRHYSVFIAAGATFLAGIRLALDPSANFVTVFNLVILWLVVRTAALFFAARHAPKPGCNWIYMAAAVDFLLALLLLAGLPVTVLVYGLFGQTSEILATFAWIVAASFIATGLLLLAAPAIRKPPAQLSG